MKIGTFLGKQIDEKMTKKELLEGIKFMVKEMEKYKERAEELEDEMWDAKEELEMKE